MTVGIAAAGPNAGQAVFEALAAVEKVAWGAIGGFATYAAIGIDPGSKNAVLHRYETQRGGSATLFTEGERTGAPPPPEVATARFAGVMSSGPDRPEPLSQFVPADAAVGLITGHRLPNGTGASGVPINIEVLEAVRRGQPLREAVDAVLDANPEADAGIIALDLAGRVYARNSDRVSRRPDLGHARREDAARGAVVEVLHNAIRPGPAIAALAAEIAMSAMTEDSVEANWVTVLAGTPIEAGRENAVLVGDDGIVRKVLTTDRRIVTGRQNCAAIYLGARVQQGDQVLGTTTFEPNVTVEDGRILSLSGQSRLRLGYRCE